MRYARGILLVCAAADRVRACGGGEGCGDEDQGEPCGHCRCSVRGVDVSFQRKDEAPSGRVQPHETAMDEPASRFGLGSTHCSNGDPSRAESRIRWRRSSIFNSPFPRWSIAWQFGHTGRRWAIGSTEYRSPMLANGIRWWTWMNSFPRSP